MPEEKAKPEVKYYPPCPFAGVSFIVVPKEKTIEDPTPIRQEPVTMPCVPGQCPQWVMDPDSDNPEDGDCAHRIMGIAAQEVANAAAAITDFLDEVSGLWQLPELAYAILHKFGIANGMIAPGEFDDFGVKKEQAEADAAAEAGETPDDDGTGEPDDGGEPPDDGEPEEEPTPPPPPPVVIVRRKPGPKPKVKEAPKA